MKTYYGDREKCYSCYRPKSSCMCGHVKPLDTETKFVILMHPKEFKKVKNGTGHLTHLSLKNSELFIGVDFTNHARVNEIIATHESFVLYPSENALNLTDTNPYSSTILHAKKAMAIFIEHAQVESMMKIAIALRHLSFSSSKLSQFKIKEQPAEYCLSTIESTLEVLELLNKWHVEKISEEGLELFLNPFIQMVNAQLLYVEKQIGNTVRFKEKKDS